MNKDRFQIISVVIGLTILTTIIIQGYWNYRNYQVNKQHFVNDVQSALDNAVESYYANMAKGTVFKMSGIDGRINIKHKRDTSTRSEAKSDTVIVSHFSNQAFKKEIKNIKLLMRGGNIDSTSSIDTVIRLDERTLIDTEWTDDNLGTLKDLATKVAISLQTERIDSSKLSTLIAKELYRKHISIDYLLMTLSLDTIRGKKPNRHEIQIQANSTYLTPGSSVELHFSNDTREILARGIIGILVSLFTGMVIIGSLIYLYQVIKNQKELAEIKNDLISNITHEFKTPIATVATALEALQNFNADLDPTKTKKYLNISESQLQKLNTMVEKLLETASLEEDNIPINLESINLSDLMTALVEKFSVTAEFDQIKPMIEANIFVKADSFHLENAISNLIDNAIKYGGEEIVVSLKRAGAKIQIVVRDNGGGISSNYKSMLFEKFYRVPTGNRHDVKGFGIGLYYVKKIVEKHGGNIELNTSNSLTEFKILI